MDQQTHESAHTDAARRTLRLYEKEGDEYYLESAKKAINRELAESTFGESGAKQ